MRKRKQKKDRTKAVTTYKARHKLDPTPFLHTDWMSDCLSADCVDSDDERAVDVLQHKRDLAAAANVNLDTIQITSRSRLNLFEVLPPGSRSDAVSKPSSHSHIT